MLTIVAVVAAAATLQASGGLDVLLQLAERLLRRNPKFISILAPFTTCGLTMLCGTGHVVYTMLPIIYDIAIKNNIRPERPMAGKHDREPDGPHREPGVGRRGVARRLPREGAGARNADQLHPAHLGHYSLDALRRARGWHLQLVPRQGPRQGRAVPGLHRRPGQPQAGLRRYRDAARQEALARPVDGYVDLHRGDTSSSPSSVPTKVCGRSSMASRCQ